MAFYRKNIGSLQQAVRIAAGVAVVVAAFVYFTGGTAWLVALSGGAAPSPPRLRRPDLVAFARAALEELRRILSEAGIEIDYDAPAWAQSAAAAEYVRLESDWEASYLMTMRAAWMADNKLPNSKEASECKAKAGRMATDLTLRAVEIAGDERGHESSLLRPTHA